MEYLRLRLEASRSSPVSRVGGRAVENERSAPALRARTSLREAGKHASLCEAMRSSRSVIYTPEALHFLEAPHIWLASNRTTLNVYAFCMAARKVAAFAQPSVLSPQSCFSAWLPARLPLLLSPQSSVLSPAFLHGCRTVAAFAQSSVLGPQSCFSAWLRGKS